MHPRPGPAPLVRAACVAVAVLVVACSGAAPPSGDPANGVTIVNATDARVFLTYSQKDSTDVGTSEAVGELGPGQQGVVDSILADRPTICRVGRIIARTADGAEVDRLELVCKGHHWTIEAPAAGG